MVGTDIPDPAPVGVPQRRCTSSPSFVISPTMDADLPYDMFGSHNAKGSQAVRPLAEPQPSTLSPQPPRVPLNQERHFIPLWLDDASLRRCRPLQASYCGMRKTKFLRRSARKTPKLAFTC